MQVSLEIRDETPEDAVSVAEVNRLAFSGEVEVGLIDRLRRDGDVFCSLVAVAGREVVGHALFSRARLEIAGNAVPAVALGPVAVRPDRQGLGTGSALIRRGLDLCRERGAAAAVVLGHPSYYPRFGFSAERARGLESPYAGSDAFMAMELSEGALGEGTGTVSYASAFADLE